MITDPWEKRTIMDGRANRRRTESRDSVSIHLPKPAHRRPGSLSMALERRQTIREISDRQLPLNTLSNLLWAACGVNRQKGPFGNSGRTAASASNSQEIDVYVALSRGRTSITR